MNINYNNAHQDLTMAEAFDRVVSLTEAEAAAAAAAVAAAAVSAARSAVASKVAAETSEVAADTHTIAAVAATEAAEASAAAAALAAAAEVPVPAAVEAAWRTRRALRSGIETFRGVRGSARAVEAATFRTASTTKTQRKARSFDVVYRSAHRRLMTSDGFFYPYFLAKKSEDIFSFERR